MCYTDISHSVINFFMKYTGHQLLTVKQLTRVEIRNRSSACQISPGTQVTITDDVEKLRFH